MGLIELKDNFLKWMFPKKEPLCEEESIEALKEIEAVNQESLTEESQILEMENIVMNKLNYLEQYIKIFSLPFPKEYKEYLNTIQTLKSEYERELEEYKRGLRGNITFSIDPEQETDKYIEVIKLEEDIKRFVEFEVEYKLWKDKFSKLCYKLNAFYNAIIGTDIDNSRIIEQLKNAYKSFEMLIKETIVQEFFTKDSRKKDDIVTYIIYSDYIIFKSALRVGIITGIHEYHQEISNVHSYFDTALYNELMFKFFIEGSEQLQDLVVDRLKSDKMYEYLVEESQRLQDIMDDYNECINSYEFFEKVIKFENTIYGLIKLHKINFTFDFSKMIEFYENDKDVISVNDIAKSILSLIDNKKAALLERIINKFNIEISWREFYFLSKIFELTADIIKISGDTVFSMVGDKFLKINEKYVEYSDEYIKSEKEKILNYSGSKSKKYIVLLDTFNEDVESIINLFNMLSLDFIIHEQKVYLNHSYFNGFKNLEENFGDYLIF